jgi:uncharacterized protein (UPF0261 family)
MVPLEGGLGGRLGRICERAGRSLEEEHMTKRIYVVGTLDTKREELLFVKGLLDDAGLDTLLVDISTRYDRGGADVSASAVAAHHPDPDVPIFEADRGRAVLAMKIALENFVISRSDIAAMIWLGGSGGTSMITPAMQTLPVGLPKIMVSAVAASDIRPYVGLSDIVMIPSVTDIDRLNRISRTILTNAVNGLFGMMTREVAASELDRPAIGITTAGVTTECQERVMDALASRFECLSFHAAGTGGPTMEKLALSGLLVGMIDIAPTEVTDLLLGGMFPCGEDRLDGVARSGLPYVGTCGALDCLKFRAPETVPARYREGTIYVHNPEVTLVRPSAEEHALIGRWIAGKLNACTGPVRFLIPRGGTSSIDAPGQPFFDPAANQALFDALEATFRATPERQLISLPYHVNTRNSRTPWSRGFRRSSFDAGSRHPAGFRTGVGDLVDEIGRRGNFEMQPLSHRAVAQASLPGGGGIRARRLQVLVGPGELELRLCGLERRGRLLEQIDRQAPLCSAGGEPAQGAQA